MSYTGESADPTLIVKDSMESVCLIQRDGLYNIFSHRSFQEYFCSLFISKYREDDVGELIDAVASVERSSNVLRMLYELSPEVFEYEWALPLLENYTSTVARLNPNTKSGLSKLMKSLFSSISFSLEDNSVTYISWPASQSVSKGVDGKWMSALQSATANAVRLYRPVFTVLWDDADQFIKSLPSELQQAAAAALARAHPYGENGEPMVQIDYDDAEWLIHSRLPEAMIAIRTAVKEYRDEIIARRGARKTSVARLIARPGRFLQ